MSSQENQKSKLLARLTQLQKAALHPVRTYKVVGSPTEGRPGKMTSSSLVTHGRICDRKSHMHLVICHRSPALHTSSHLFTPWYFVLFLTIMQFGVRPWWQLSNSPSVARRMQGRA